MSLRLPQGDDYQPSTDPQRDALERLWFIHGVMTWLLDKSTPVWITGNDPASTFAAVSSLKEAHILCGGLIANFAGTQNAASCQNAAPRLSETTEPQAL